MWCGLEIIRTTITYLISFCCTIELLEQLLDWYSMGSVHWIISDIPMLGQETWMLLIRDGEAVAPLSSIPVREGFRNSSPCSSKADQVSVFQTNVLGASITLIYRSPCTQTSTSCTQIAPRLQLHASLLCHLCLLHSGCGADNFLSAPHVVQTISYPHHMWCG